MAQERFIQLSLQRKLKSGGYAVISTRSYVHAHHAAMKAVELLLFGGQPGDVVEVAHKETGNQFGTVKIGAKGTLTIDIQHEHPMLIGHSIELRDALMQRQQEAVARMEKSSKK